MIELGKEQIGVEHKSSLSSVFRSPIDSGIPTMFDPLRSSVFSDGSFPIEFGRLRMDVP